MSETTTTANIAELAPRKVGTYSEVGWSPPLEGLDPEQWAEQGKILKREYHEAEQSLDTRLWRRGDWLNYGEDAFGEEASQEIEEEDYTDGALGVVARTCEAFPHDKRHSPAHLTFWKHAEIRHVKDAGARWRLADTAADEGWTKIQCREAVQDWKRESAEEPLFEDEQPDPGLHPCPLCDGAGQITGDRRAAYFKEESLV